MNSSKATRFVRASLLLMLISLFILSAGLIRQAWSLSVKLSDILR